MKTYLKHKTGVHSKNSNDISVIVVGWEYNVINPLCPEITKERNNNRRNKTHVVNSRKGSTEFYGIILKIRNILNRTFIKTKCSNRLKRTHKVS